eukprot:IDg9694t1
MLARGYMRAIAIVLTVVVTFVNVSTQDEAAVKGKKIPSSVDVLRDTCKEGGVITCMKAVARFMSSPIVLNEVVPIFEQRMPRPYQMTERLLSRPLVQPYDEELFELSFMVKDDHVTEELSNPVSVCRIKATCGLGRRWGLFSVNQFLRGLFQLEYFVFAKEYAEQE